MDERLTAQMGDLTAQEGACGAGGRLRRRRAPGAQEGCVGVLLRA